MTCHALLQGIFLTQGSNCISHTSCIGRWVLYPECNLRSPMNYHLGRVKQKTRFPVPFQLILIKHSSGEKKSDQDFDKFEACSLSSRQYLRICKNLSLIYCWKYRILSTELHQHFKNTRYIIFKWTKYLTDLVTSLFLFPFIKLTHITTFGDLLNKWTWHGRYYVKKHGKHIWGFKIKGSSSMTCSNMWG